MGRYKGTAFGLFSLLSAPGSGRIGSLWSVNGNRRAPGRWRSRTTAHRFPLTALPLWRSPLDLCWSFDRIALGSHLKFDIKVLIFNGLWHFSMETKTTVVRGLAFDIVVVETMSQDARGILFYVATIYVRERKRVSSGSSDARVFPAPARRSRRMSSGWASAPSTS